MTPVERRAAVSLSGLFALRMLGLFIVLPVLAVFAATLAGGEDKTLVGLAFGAYGLTQAILQIPFGWLSDRHGRKPMLYLGLLLFAAGSLLAATSEHVITMIAGRVLQGAGAISAVAIAMLADLTRIEVRTRAMGLVGASIGLSFMLSLILGPLLAGAVGVPGLFVVTGLLALAAMAVVRYVVPDHRVTDEYPQPEASAFLRVFANRELLRLNYGIFAVHAVLVMFFMEVPHALESFGLPVARHWTVYLPVLLVSLIPSIPAMMQADNPARAKTIFAGAVGLLLVAHLMLRSFSETFAGLIASLIAFFAAFNLLEAKLPSLVSKIAPAEIKGTAIGVYSSVQFLGVFFGGLAGGWLQQHHGPGSIFWFGIALTAAWLVLVIAMPSLTAYNYTLARQGRMDSGGHRWPRSTR